MPRLLTPELEARLPQLYSQEGNPDPAVQVLLLGASGWVWALYEYSETAPDRCRNLGFGKVYGDYPELGYVPMDELDEVNARYLPGHEPVWVDEAFTPRPLSQVEAEIGETKARLPRALDDGSHLVVRLTAIEV